MAKGTIYLEPRTHHAGAYEKWKKGESDSLAPLKWVGEIRVNGKRKRFRSEDIEEVRRWLKHMGALEEILSATHE